MPVDKMDVLMQRRAELLARISAQRAELTEFGTRYSAPVGLIDQGRAVVRYLSEHPLLAAAGAAMLVLRRRSLLGMAGGVWSLWEVYRTASKLIKSLASKATKQ